MRPNPFRILVLLLSAGLLLASCGGDDDETSTSADDVADAADGDRVADGGDTDLDDMAEGMVDDLEAQQEAAGGGGATFTVDGQTYEFDAVLCAMGEDETGQEGAELVVSAIADGLQFYVSIDSFGNSISLNDVEDFENPSVSLSASEVVPGDVVTIEVDGKQVTGSSDAFRDDTSDDVMATVSGSFEATCP